MYESESKAEETDHHQLLKDIQQGVKLRKVKTNDKSKPYIEGTVITEKRCVQILCEIAKVIEN